MRASLTKMPRSKVTVNSNLNWTPTIQNTPLLYSNGNSHRYYRCFTNYFQKFVNVFVQTATQIEQDPQASQYADAYSKLFETMYSYYERNKELEGECESMRDSIATMKYRLEVAEVLTEKDAATIEELKNQIQQTWKTADASHYREQVAQETIDNLRKQNAELTAELDLKNKLAQESTEE